MTTPLERSATLVIGTIDSVAPSEFKVQLETDAPQTTALNTGSPVPFPRINSYVLVPGQGGAVVGQVTWIGIERSQFPKRKGLKDFGLIDLPFPLRRLAVTPIGTLRIRTDPGSGDKRLELERGVSLFPSVGDPVSLPTGNQLKAIVEVPEEQAPVTIGRSALADGAVVRVHPDRLFGRHLAVLGNTGSGKSCSVAGAVRWTIEAVRANRAKTEHRDRALAGSPGQRGCRFVVLDPNGEYKEAFRECGARVRVLAPPPASGSASPLVVPAWMWNAQEWSSILQASPGVQQPILFEALRRLRSGDLSMASQRHVLAKALRQFGERFKAILSNVAEAFTGGGKRMESGACLNGIVGLAREIATDAASDNALLESAAKKLLAASERIAKRVNADFSRDVPTISELQEINATIDAVLALCPATLAEASPSADHPAPFDLKKLSLTLQLCALASGDNRAVQIVAYLIGRLESLVRDARLSPIIDPVSPVALDTWLGEFLGEPDAAEDSIVVVDLALVPSDVSHLIVAVIARVLFEATQRYHKGKREAFPTVLVLEEAHTFVQEGRDDPSQSPTPVQMCRRIFEKIAREGRKFGMGLVLSSQRPSEISPTVLSQCNTFLLHRLVNDDDQNLVRRLVPDTLSALLRELPILPTRHAIMLGYASPVPKMVVLRELPAEHRPRSSDPPVWDVWRGVEPRPVDWTALAKDWADPGSTTATTPPSAPH
jgi:hypothetical protein